MISSPHAFIGMDAGLIFCGLKLGAGYEVFLGKLFLKTLFYFILTVMVL